MTLADDVKARGRGVYVLCSADVKAQVMSDVIGVANPHIDHTCAGFDAYDLCRVFPDGPFQDILTPVCGPGLTKKDVYDGGACRVVKFDHLSRVCERGWSADTTRGSESCNEQVL